MSKTRVLCVDDNPDAVRSVTDLLELSGCEVKGCPDGPTALAAAEQFRPDVCLIDLTMPGMSGEELAQKLREQAAGRPVRIIALTGRMDPDSHHRTSNLGFDAHLVKPADPARLLEVVAASR